MADRTARSGTNPARSRLWGLGAALLLCLFALAPFSARGVAAAPNPGATTVLDGAGADRDLGAGPSRDYMTVTLNLTQQAFVRVAFTGYAFAKSSAGGTITPGCPCLVRGELRANNDTRQIVTRTALATDADDVVADPAANPAVAAADRRDFSGSHVFSLPAGSHTFTMSLTREVGTAQNVGFGFGRMQAVVLPGAAPENFAVLDGAGADRDLGADPARDYMTTTLTTTQQSFVRVSFTGYAFAKADAGNTRTPGCPCLVRGEGVVVPDDGMDSEAEGEFQFVIGGVATAAVGADLVAPEGGSTLDHRLLQGAADTPAAESGERGEGQNLRLAQRLAAEGERRAAEFRADRLHDEAQEPTDGIVNQGNEQVGTAVIWRGRGDPIGLPEVGDDLPEFGPAGVIGVPLGDGGHSAFPFILGG